MGRFRSAPGAKYHDSLDDYRNAQRGGNATTTLFRIVDAFDPAGRLPWLTFVLGSGCLTNTEPQPTATDAEVRSALIAGLAASDLDLDPGLTNRVQDYFRALVAKKLPDSGALGWVARRAASTEPGVVAWPIAMISCAIAALATSELARLMTDTAFVIDRADQEVVRIDSDVDVSDFADYLVRARRLIAQHAHSGEQDVAAYLTLLGSVHEGLTGMRAELWRSQVEALTGFAWHFITDGTAIYPGWTDMLLFQAAGSKLNADEFTRVPFLRRPVVENARPLENNSVLLERLREVTKRSLQGDDGARDDFYERVARILLQQAGVRKGGRDTRVPLATAFSASFDLELEIALWNAISRGETTRTSFAVVVPVYVVDEDAPLGGLNTELYWLWRTVTPPAGSSPGLMLAEEPDGTDHVFGPWRVIDTVKPNLPSALTALPIVVHLAGAPLLPMGSGVEALFDRAISAVHHALLLDEHLATVQFAEDLLDKPGPGQLHGEFARASTSSFASPRFWAFIGTQLADPAIRLRLVANELRAFRQPDQTEEEQERQRRERRDESSAGAAGRPHDDEADGEGPHGGIVINDWVPAEEREVFRWFGYDIVRGKAEDLIPDLDDFAVQAQGRIQRQEGPSRGAA